MCGSMVDVQSATAEIRRGKQLERRRNHKERGGELGPNLTQSGLGRGLLRTNGILIHPAVWPQLEMGQKVGWVLCPLLRGAGSPSNAMSPVPRPTSVPHTWHLDPSSRLATTDIWAENWVRAVPFLGGGTGSHLTQSGRGLRPCQVSS